MGGRLDVCDKCGLEQPVFHSCRNRHCPTCQSLSQARWIERRMQRLLPTDYFHVVFTVPDDLLNGLALRNREAFFDMLFAAASQTLLQLGADPKRLGAQLGATLVLHTWTRELKFHAHLHCIVTGGGLHADGTRWVHGRQGYLFPVQVLSKLFRGKVVAALVEARQSGQLALPTSLAAPRAFAQLKDSLYKTKWVAYAKEPFAGPEQVFHYLGRYTHRVGLSNQRLLGLTADGVHFRTRGEATATLSPDEFIRRFVQHVLPRGFVKIRHYGLMAPSNATTKLEVARRLLEAEHPDLPAVVGAFAAVLLLANAAKRLTGTPAPGDDWRAHFERLTGIDVSRCPRCNVGRLTPHPLPLLWAKKPPDDTS